MFSKHNNKPVSNKSSNSKNVNEITKRNSMLSLSSFSNSDSNKYAQVLKKIIKHVATCKNCAMISISDKKRSMCPYCGSFYTPPQNKEHINPRIYKMNGKEVQNNDSSCSEDTPDENCSNDFENEEININNPLTNNANKIKQFFLDLLRLNKKSSSRISKNIYSSSSSNISSYANNDSSFNDYHEDSEYEIIEYTDLKHKFLTVKNRDSTLFKEYFKELVKTEEEFKILFRNTINTLDFNKISDFYCWIFSKPSNLIELLIAKKQENTVYFHQSNDNKKHDGCLKVTTDWRFMSCIYNSLQKMPSEVTQLTLEAICFCIVNDLKGIAKKLKGRILNLKQESLTRSEDLNGEKSRVYNSISTEMKENLNIQIIEIIHTYVILLCNPMLDKIENNILLSIILEEIANLNNFLQNALIFALRRMPLSLFREVLRKVQSFFVVRLFSANEYKLINISSDWMSHSVKVMALLNRTNEMQIQYYQNHYNDYISDALNHLNEKKKQNKENSHFPPLSLTNIVNSSTKSSSLFISYQEFYIRQLDSLDLFKEYIKWETIRSNELCFSLCQYPFMLSIDAKRKILECDSEQNMIQTAKRSYLSQIKTRHNVPNALDLFLTVKIRRNNLIADSLNEIELKKKDLKKKLRVEFIDEAAIDMGGVRKEWFLLLVRDIFSPLYGMFSYIKETNYFWFSMTADQSMLAEYNLIGVLMGLAVYNSEILDIKFPPCVYKKLASMESLNSKNKSSDFGVLSSLTLFDLKYVMPSIATSLQSLLDYEGDVQEDFMQTFEISFSEFDIVKTIPLKDNGGNIELTNQNKKEYVTLYVDYILNRSIYEQFKAFYNGFHSVCDSNAMILFKPEEIELLVCGSTEPFDINELKMITSYDGYSESDDIIKWFWSFVQNDLDLEKKKRLLLFTTGSDRIPIGGVKDMTFKIIRIESHNQLPMAHTCFNQLILPNYESKETLVSKLLIAIQNAEGFGFK